MPRVPLQCARATALLGALLAFLCVALSGCASTPRPPPQRGFGALLSTAPKIDPKSKIAPPTGDCLTQAYRFVESPDDLVKPPLAPNLRARLEAIVDGLHPLALQVMRRTTGLWYAENIPGASAIFLPCDVDQTAHTGGFVLIDLGEFPLDEPLRDADVPKLYWKSLAGRTATRRAYSISELDGDRVTRTDHAIRYLLLHELGHALSLHANEFELDTDARIRVANLDGFTGYSWQLVTTSRRLLPRARGGPTVQAVVPRRALGTLEWGSMLEAVDADAELLAPGYALLAPQSADALEREVCSVVSKLPRAGFVTPTAARYPTEDFAEMFAHAILAAEGKLKTTDRIRIRLRGCGPQTVVAPYFAPELAAKRAFMERELGLAR